MIYNVNSKFIKDALHKVNEMSLSFTLTHGGFILILSYLE